MEYITSAEMAEKHGVIRRMVNILCQRGEIEGTRKKGNRWIIPDRNIKKMGNGKSLVKPFPIGISDFSKAISDYYYVDKTLLIKEIIDNKLEVSLFLRPRRFGKTLNMDMLRTVSCIIKVPKVAEPIPQVYKIGAAFYKKRCAVIGE